jgi:hypothetical protein
MVVIVGTANDGFRILVFRLDIDVPNRPEDTQLSKTRAKHESLGRRFAVTRSINNRLSRIFAGMKRKNRS